MYILIFNIISIPIEYFLVSALAAIGKTGDKFKRRLFIFVVFIQLFILHAFLDPNVMEDLPGYYDTYDFFARNSLYESIFIGQVGVKMEPGWIIICKLLSYLSMNPRLMLIFSSILIVGAYSIAFYKYSPYTWLSYFILLCTIFDQSLFVLRQHSAMAICLLSVPYIINRKPKQFFTLFIIACTIHMTSVIFLPLYFLYKVKINELFLVKFLIISFVGLLFARPIFSWLFSHTWYNSYEETDGSNAVMFFINLCVLMLFLYSKNWNVNRVEGATKCFFLMMCIASFISLCGIGFSPTNRLVKYYTIAGMLLIPTSIYNLRDKVLKSVIIICVVLLYFALFFSESNLEFIRDYRLS